MQIDKIYEPQRFEPHWSQWWIDPGIFHASAKAGGRVFSLVIPPPNVTGSLHIGHMLEHTEIDVTIRWHRMLGDNTLGLPGTDQSWSHPLPPEPARSWHAKLVAEVRWDWEHLVPWVWRSVRHRSSGDGRAAKRPNLEPVTHGI